MTLLAGERPKELLNRLPAGARRLVGSLSVTLAGNAISLIGLLLITRISASSFGAVGFGEFQVARRTLAVVALPLMCGLGISLPRYLARNVGDRREVAKWLYSGLALSTILVGFFLVAGLSLSAQIGRWTFGDSGERSLVLALIVAVVGMFCNTLALSTLRGFSRFHAAAVLQVVNGFAVPLTGVLLAPGRVERALAITGVLWLVFACTVLIGTCRRCAYPGLSFRDIGAAMRSLLAFGAPRVPGEIALFGLFALPAFAAVHRNNIVGAGFLSVGLSLIQAVGTVFAAAGFVLLPYWSRATKNSHSLLLARKQMGILVVASGFAAALGLTLLQVFLKPIARLMLGSLAEAGMHDLRYVSLGAVPYVIYLVLRDYFDAVSVFPRNTVALTCAIAIQAALLSVRSLNIAVATAGSFLGLGFIMVALWLSSAPQIDSQDLAEDESPWLQTGA